MARTKKQPVGGPELGATHPGQETATDELVVGVAPLTPTLSPPPPKGEGEGADWAAPLTPPLSPPLTKGEGEGADGVAPLTPTGWPFSRSASIAGEGAEPRTPNSEPRTPNPEPPAPNPEPGTPNSEPRTPNSEPGTPSSFAELVLATDGLDTKTYRIARLGDSAALAERVGRLELAPAELKAQAVIYLRDYAPAVSPEPDAGP